MKNPNRCPECDGPGQWRRGVGFEHEKICMAKHGDKGHIVWCPDDIRNQQAAALLERMPDRVRLMLEKINKVYADVDFGENSEGWWVCLRGHRGSKSTDGVVQNPSLVTLNYNGSGWSAEYSLPLRGVLRELLTREEYMAL